MEMRSQKGWASFRMNSNKWVVETAEYNRRLAATNQSRGLETIKKHPRALLEKLLKIEIKVVERIQTNDFSCEYNP